MVGSAHKICISQLGVECVRIVHLIVLCVTCLCLESSKLNFRSINPLRSDIRKLVTVSTETYVSTVH
jgi:hypothetical protein